ncbi:SDR family NAD(P)-dependent oxidoreductase [Sporolactobacillus laevolacticus]|uniref:SDR family NAD(P)-dependent oxidoreductase n=1 Tax=Sporolactobacillus laevolacticus TaxID=33018 RepID=UPI0025B302F6|nr:SDR family NAD(P)-dependent oxidoreductase [Sporolactobacillus laevolacticus]MDN3955027.1 SDR family NAD(P)-dependent oxidoreductase [Sporolactobacillus laevolacticus]
MDFQEKVFVITGGSSGIGKATAIELVKRGAKVVINGRNEHALTDAAHEIDPTGAHVHGVAGDIADLNTADRVITEGLAHFGRVDTLINNAGAFIAKPFTENSEAYFNTVFSINIAGFVTGEILHVDGGQNAGH